MTAVQELPAGAPGSAMVHAAIRYAERGWPVLPGSVCDGRRYVLASTHVLAVELRPVLPRDQASTDMGLPPLAHNATTTVRFVS